MASQVSKLAVQNGWWPILILVAQDAGHGSGAGTGHLSGICRLEVLYVILPLVDKTYFEWISGNHVLINPDGQATRRWLIDIT